ncbi:fused MFS/spermidine synthase, partial [Candidatus Sumerlaeota bacterium]|nr:fused MFS/spermidine synthase [Candidatus Sumerlaeota bacterium]
MVLVRYLIVFAILSSATLSQAYDVLFEGESLYHHVRVTEEEGFRNLAFDRTRGTQSTVKVSDPIFLYYVYTRLAFAGLAFCENPQDVLFVGLGGGSMPRFFRHHYPEADIDIVEIDPMVVEVARKYFFFSKEGEDPRMRVFVNDGRVFLRKTDKKY